MTYAGRRIVGGVIGLVLLTSLRAGQEVSGHEAELARVVAEAEELAFEVPGRAVRRAEEGLVESSGVGAAELARLTARARRGADAGGAV